MTTWSDQFSSVAQSCPILCDPMDCSMPGFLVRHQLPELTQTHVHQVSDAIQPSHPLSSPFPPAFNLPLPFPASVSFPMSQLFASGGQSVAASATIFYQLCIQSNLHLLYLYSRNTLCYCTSLSNSAFRISHWQLEISPRSLYTSRISKYYKSELDLLLY